MTQATIDALRAYIERQAALGQILVDKFPDDPDFATAANQITALADDATDALAVEPVE